ncbi:MAG: hypothetical protein HY648_12005 [Acidobacteria bacterium]|nr:hypothetical protein [Acidobacteriota bacterium]
MITAEGIPMSFWELLGLVSAMATILGVFLTIYGFINNRTIKEESRLTREILDRIERGQAEARKEMAEAMAQARKEMAEAVRYLAELIHTDGERTRQAIRAPSGPA